MRGLSTYEQVQDLAQAVERIEHKSGAHRRDGRITPAEIIASALAIILIAFAGVAAGAGVGIAYRLLTGQGIPGLEGGLAAGLIVGGLAVGYRTAADIVADPALADRHLGEPIDPADFAIEPPSVRVELVEKTQGGLRLRRIDLPASDTELTRIAREVLERGQPFSRRGLEHILSQERYRKLSDAMLERGLLVENADKSRDLMAVGRAVLWRFLRGEVSSEE